MATPRTAILKRNGSIYYYDNYGDARTYAVSRDMIIILSNLDNEQIILKDEVDIWIKDGVKINFTSGSPTITDNNQPVKCKIYGQGIIKNTYNGNCVYTNHDNTELSIESYTIDGEGSGSSSISVYAKQANIFHLSCSKVFSKSWQAIQTGEFFNPGLIPNLNLNISKVETGDLSNPSIGTTAVSTRGNGFINMNEIVCNNLGHSLTHHEGSITAKIKKLTTSNRRTGNSGSTLHIGQYSSSASGTQKLILYFDEIKALGTQLINSTNGIEISEGTVILIGRRVYSANSNSLHIAGSTTKGYVKCNEMISDNSNSIVLNDSVDEITVDVNFIKGNADTTVFSYGTSTAPGKFLIKNARIKNTSDSSYSKGIYIQNTNPEITLNNVKIISGNQNGNIIYLASGTSVSVKNYGLFGNYDPASTITLIIGDSINYLFVSDPDLN